MDDDADFVLLYEMQLIFFLMVGRCVGGGVAAVGEKRAGHHQVFHPETHPLMFTVKQLHASPFLMDLEARRAAPRQKRQ